MYTGIEIKDDIIQSIIKKIKDEVGPFKAQERFKELRTVGKARQKENREIIRAKIDEFVSLDGVIDAESLMKEWFPEIKADIFLSHSSKDESDVHLIVGYFKEELGLKVFVDSLVWGYSGKLLKDLNNKYAKNYSGNYDYDPAMWLSSNVNLMLNTALNKMIDKTECLLFFSTPNSVSSSEGDKDNGSMSNSPWIYSELSMADTMRKNVPKRHIKKVAMESVGVGEALEFEDKAEVKFVYSLPNTLIKLEEGKLKDWLNYSASGLDRLDNLYDILGIIKRKEIKSETMNMMFYG